LQFFALFGVLVFFDIFLIDELGAHDKRVIDFFVVLFANDEVNYANYGSSEVAPSLRKEVRLYQSKGGYDDSLGVVQDLRSINPPSTFLNITLILKYSALDGLNQQVNIAHEVS
jgi:hypothetical protein